MAMNLKTQGTFAGRMGNKAPAVAGLVLLLAAGCIGVPDAQEMRNLRAAAATERMTGIEEKQTTGNAIFLSGPLKLADAVDMALKQNRALQQERQGREIARGRIRESYAEALPALGLSGGYTRRDEELGTTVNGTYIPTRYQDQYSAGLKLTQPLYNGRIGAALRAAKLYEAWAEAGLRGATEDVRHEVVRAYYEAVLSAHLLEVNLAALATAEGQLAQAKARRQQGMASNYDELRAEVEVSNFQAQVLQARNSQDLAHTTLFRLLGASPVSTVELVDEIPRVAEEISFGAAVRTALERRADLIEAEYALRMQRESVQVAKSRYLPDVSGYAAQTWANPDPHNSSQNEWGDEWQAGVQLSWPLFDGFGRSGALIQERAKLRQLEIGLQDAEERAVSQVRQAVLSLKTAEEFAHSQSQNLETAKEALRLVEAGLREGQNTPLEVMDARQALTKASANYYQSLFNHAMARVALQKAMGLLADGALPDAPVLKE
jgi:outer membrane protein